MIFFQRGVPGKEHEVITTYKLNRLGADRGIVGKSLASEWGGLCGHRWCCRLAFRIAWALSWRLNGVYAGTDQCRLSLDIGGGPHEAGVTLQQAQADMDTVTSHIAAAYPKSIRGGEQLSSR